LRGIILNEDEQYEYVDSLSVIVNKLTNKELFTEIDSAMNTVLQGTNSNYLINNFSSIKVNCDYFTTAKTTTYTHDDGKSK
jgi:hypothetical protein